MLSLRFAFIQPSWFTGHMMVKRRHRPRILPFSSRVQQMYFSNAFRNSCTFDEAWSYRRDIAATHICHPIQKRNASSVFPRLTEYRPWHYDSFMSESTTYEKEEWLDKLLKSTNAVSFRDRLSSPPVDLEAFLVVLKSLSKHENGHDDAGAPRRAEMWMNRLLTLYASSEYHPDLQPTSECYQHVIQAWANSEREQILVIVNRAERWLNDLLEQSDSEQAQILSSILSASSSSSQSIESSHDDSKSKERDFHHHGNPRGTEPTIECFNAFLDACTRGRPGRNKKAQRIVLQNAKKAESILRRLHSLYHHYGEESDVILNTVTFNLVIRGWTRCKFDETIPSRVLALVRLMESYQRDNPLDSHIRPDTKSYSMAMDALASAAKRKARKYYETLKHNHNLNQNNDLENPSKNGMDEINEIHAILTYMHELYDAGVEAIVPHFIPYNILITAYSGVASFSPYHRNNAPFKVEEILRTMISHRENGFTDASPDVVSYEKVMLTWANSGHPNAGKRATWWLKQLWKEYELQRESKVPKSDKRLLPTVSTYNIVMKALSRTDGALAAENLLIDLGERYQSDNIPELCPNSESFAIIIRAWLRNCEKSTKIDDRIPSLKRAVEWLSSLKEVENERNLSTAPDLFTYALQMAARCATDRPAILDMAKDVFEDLRHSRHRLDFISYGFLLQVGLQAYRKPEYAERRRMFVETLFAECCEDGLLSNRFVRTITDTPTDECKELTENMQDQWPLPASWSRNVKNTTAFIQPSDILNSAQRHSQKPKRRHRFKCESTYVL